MKCETGKMIEGLVVDDLHGHASNAEVPEHKENELVIPDKQEVANHDGYVSYNSSGELVIGEIHGHVSDAETKEAEPST